MEGGGGGGGGGDGEKGVPIAGLLWREVGDSRGKQLHTRVTGITLKSM